jgi:2-iminobutanoate/2-iminopropanoate deaminase
MSGSARYEIRSQDAPEALGPYNQGVVTSASKLLFISGQIGIDPATGDLVGGGVARQTEQCIGNILAIVRSAGGSSRSIVKTTIYLAKIEDFSDMNGAYAKATGAPYPARSCVGGCDLPKGALVEIEAVAALEE